MRGNRFIQAVVLGVAFAGLGSWPCLAQSGAPGGDQGAKVQAAGPKLVLPPARDLGEIGAKEVRSFSLQIRNDGDAPLHLKRIQPSCGCTMAEPPAMEIAAHQVITVPLTFNATGYAGPIHKTIIVDSDDPKEPSAIWAFTGTVKRAYLFQPNGAAVQADAHGKAATIEFRFIPLKQSEPIKSVTIVPMPDEKAPLPRWISYKWEPKNGEVLVRVTLDPQQIKDAELDDVTDSGFQRCRVIMLPVQGDAEEGQFIWGVKATGVPPKAVSSVLPASQQGTVEKSMRVLVAAPKAFRVLKVKSTNPGLTGTVEAEGGSGKQFWVIPHAQGLKPGRYAETLTLITDNPEFPTIRVRVYLLLT
jgi:hypothetical protein